MRYCFVFVCQAGELELKALLLAASLRRHLRCEHELVAAVPQPVDVFGTPAAATLETLRRMGARIVAIENPVDPAYGIGNKIACLGIETDADKVVFMDSDMLSVTEFHGHPRFEGTAVNVKPSDLPGVGAESSQWDAAYAACGAQMPSWRVCATVSGQSMLPYFNAGFIACDRASGLAQEWVACARAIEASSAVREKRPWLDQIALAVAIQRRGLAVDCLDERFNFPAHLKPLEPGSAPIFCHYHYPAVIRREPVLNDLVRSLAAEHPEIAQTCERYPEWKALLGPTAARGAPVGKVAAAYPELVVTGIPRSGTSYLCKLIHGVPDCVVINEPREIFAPLQAEPVPYGVALFYRDVRRDVLDGKPVRNKLDNGEFIEDTAQVDKVEEYRPAVGRPDFLLGTKNTLAYLARLPQIRRAMPRAGIVACVRHPLDTIASWKSTFAHLAEGNLEAQVVGNSADPMLAGVQRQRLLEIAAAESLPVKRALMWRYLAQVVLDNRDRVLLLRYEDLVADPSGTVARVLKSVPGMFEADIPRIAPTPLRGNRSALDAEDIAAIRGICGQAAAELGYDAW